MTFAKYITNAVARSSTERNVRIGMMALYSIRQETLRIVLPWIRVQSRVVVEAVQQQNDVTSGWN